MIKVLNLYAGIGGNRKLWTNCKVTAVEMDENIAKIYQDFFPDDTVIIGDAHEYLLENFNNFDFIWSSPPCPSHSKARKNLAIKSWGVQNKPIYPEMTLYQEILFLQGYAENKKWVVENVISWYNPLIQPRELAAHYFWSNFYIPIIDTFSRGHESKIEELQKRKGFDLSKYSGIDKKKTLRNCVEPEIGLHIYEQINKRAGRERQNSQLSLFADSSCAAL